MGHTVCLLSLSLIYREAKCFLLEPFGESMERYQIIELLRIHSCCKLCDKQLCLILAHWSFLNISSTTVYILPCSKPVGLY